MYHRFDWHDDWTQLAKWASVDLASIQMTRPKRHLDYGRFYPVLRRAQVSAKCEVVWMREGLIPSYACDERGADQRAEAHAEAMTCHSCFRSAFLRRRCLIPAKVLHERRHLSTNIEQPCSFALESGNMFGIAAVWETWTNGQGHTIDSFAIVTAHVTPTLRTLFDRMPVVLTDPDEQERWLRISKDHDHPPIDLMRPLSIAQLRDWKMTPGPVDLHLVAAEAANYVPSGS